MRELVNSILVSAIAWLSGRGTRQLDRLRLFYSTMSDDELRSELHELMRAEERKGREQRHGRVADPPRLHSLAIACCVFDRRPCDLPDGATLYPQQRLAAMLLIDGNNVQMETGEGKTYAIVLAAVAALAEHPQSIILTPNSYLSNRDFARVRSFLGALDVPSFVGVPEDSFRGIAYCTLSDLAFAYLHRRYDLIEGSYPRRAAIFVDEIDATLIDIGGVHSLVRKLRPESDAWGSIFELVRTWNSEHYEQELISGDVQLRQSAWRQIAKLSREISRPVSVLLSMAAAALWALSASLDREFRIEDGRVRRINPATGETFSSGELRDAALEFLHLDQTPSVTHRMAEVDARLLVARHPLVAGTSGTAAAETLHFLQLLGTFTVAVPPKFKRHPGDISVVASGSRAATYRHVKDRILAAGDRPVVIGAWSPAQAMRLWDYLLGSLPVQSRQVNVIIKFDSETDQRIIDAAGMPGRVTIISQGGSRGIDIRSSHKPLLIILGKSPEPRLDRQFLGRVGRHGEPFDAEFVIDNDSPVHPTFGLNILGDSAVPVDRRVDRALRQAQRNAWLVKTRQRSQATLLSRTLDLIELDFSETLGRYFGLAAENDSEQLVDELLNHRDSGPGIGVKSRDHSQAREELLTALRARHTQDKFIADLEAALDRAHALWGGNPRQVHTVLGNPEEVKCLTKWLTVGAIEMIDRPAEILEMFRNQVQLAESQLLPAPSNPHIRSTGRIVREVFLSSNIEFLRQVDAIRDRIHLSTPRDLINRRASFAITNADKLRVLDLGVRLAEELSSAATPHLLDDLFYESEHTAPGPPGAERGASAPTAPPRDLVDGSVKEPVRSASLASAIDEFLNQFGTGRMSFGLSRAEARLLLNSLVRQALVRDSSLTPQVLEERVDRFVDSLRVQTHSGSAVREDERAIYGFMEFLYRKGQLTFRPRRRNSLRQAWNRARTYLGFVPRIGLALVLVHLLLFGAGALLVRPPSRSFGLLSTGVDVFGFGEVLPDRPLLAYFAAIVLLMSATRSLGLMSSPQGQGLVVVGLAVPFTIAHYWGGTFGDNLAVLGLALMSVAWLSVLLVLHRHILALVGIDIWNVTAAASVIALLLEGEVWLVAGVLVGSAAVVGGGPSLPVEKVGTSGSGATAWRGARLRLPIDQTLMSAFAAFLLCVAWGVSGVVGAFVFLVSQVLVFSALAHRRLSVKTVVSKLARARAGLGFTIDNLGPWLRRRVLAASGVSVLIAVIAGSAFVREDFARSELLVAQWAGLILVSGTVALFTGVTPSAVPLRFVDANESQDSVMDILRERAIRLRDRTRLTVPLAVAAGVLMALRWFADWKEVATLVGDLTHWVFRLF